MEGQDDTTAKAAPPSPPTPPPSPPNKPPSRPASPPRIGNPHVFDVNTAAWGVPPVLSRSPSPKGIPMSPERAYLRAHHRATQLEGLCMQQIETINTMMAEMHRMRDDGAQLLQERNTFRDEGDALRDALSRHEREIAELREELVAAQEEVSNLQKDLQDRETQAAEVGAKEAECEQLRRDLEERDMRVGELAREVRELKAKEKDGSRLQKLQGEVDRLRSVQAEVEGLKATLAGTEQRLKNAADLRRELEHRLDDQGGELRRIYSKLTESQRAADALADEVRAAKAKQQSTDRQLTMIEGYLHQALGALRGNVADPTPLPRRSGDAMVLASLAAETAGLVSTILRRLDHFSGTAETWDSPPRIHYHSSRNATPPAPSPSHFQSQGVSTGSGYVLFSADGSSVGGAAAQATSPDEGPPTITPFNSDTPFPKKTPTPKRPTSVSSTSSLKRSPVKYIPSTALPGRGLS